MQDKTRVEDSVWAGQLKEELEKRTRRKDIEVTVSPYRRYDALVSCAADKHPIVDFYADIQGDTARVKKAFDDVFEMLENWEVTQIQHNKAKEDSLPFHEKLVQMFPHLELVYTVFDFDSHYVRVAKVDDKIAASFDLWPKMTESDVKRIALYIKDFEDTLQREKATEAGVTYSWK